MAYRNIIFGLGNVMVKLGEGATTQAFEQLGRGQPDHVRENPETLRHFQGMGAGLVSNEEFFAVFRRMTREDVTNEQITDATNAMLHNIPDAKKQKLVDLLKRATAPSASTAPSSSTGATVSTI